VVWWAAQVVVVAARLQSPAVGARRPGPGLLLLLHLRLLHLGLLRRMLRWLRRRLGCHGRHAGARCLRREGWPPPGCSDRRVGGRERGGTGAGARHAGVAGTDVLLNGRLE